MDRRQRAAVLTKALDEEMRPSEDSFVRGVPRPSTPLTEHRTRGATDECAVAVLTLKLHLRPNVASWRSITTPNAKEARRGGDHGGE